MKLRVLEWIGRLVPEIHNWQTAIINLESSVCREGHKVDWLL